MSYCAYEYSYILHAVYILYVALLICIKCYRGLRVISKFRRERMEAIAHEINAYDVVALQEVCMTLLLL